MKSTMRVGGAAVIAAMVMAAGTTSVALAGPEQGASEKKPDFPPFDKVSEGLTKVVSTADGSSGLYDLYKDDKTGKLLAVLNSDYEKQLMMISCTISGGDPQAGVMGPTHYVKWEKIDKQLALVAPNLGVRTDGDKQAKDSVEQLYTGRVILSVPIVAMQGSRPVIDFGAMATKQSGKFFGPSVFGGYGPSGGAMNARLAKLTKTKSFPENVIVEYQMPRASGRIVRLTLDVSELKGTPGYKPRQADSRVGYFYDFHEDYAKIATEDVTDRYISRWNIEKASDKLKISPPKQPLVWYIEHTTPVEFRRYVREGIELWNEAYREIGIDGALEVRQQDESTGAFMDIDPEDARYNFFRWNTSNQGYAIGPSRTNPLTGEILDADVVWHQGLTRAVRGMLTNLAKDLTEQTFSPDTLAWFDQHPDWDPRVILSTPEQKAQTMAMRAVEVQAATEHELGDTDHPWTRWSSDQTNSACKIGNMLSVDMSLAAAAMDVGILNAGDESDLLDGLPEEFIGPMIRYITAHEVGHCLGLQHNMAASTIRSLEEINSPGYEGATIGSVMDYCAPNINHGLGEVQGPYATPTVGPYDHWAIAFGYGPEKDVEKVLSRVGEPDHVFVSQVAMSVGSDPRNMTWDFGADNLRFAESRLSLANELRAKLLEDVVKEGESWAVARRRFNALMGTHIQSMFIAGNWIGGTFTNNDWKGDPGDRAPIEDVPAERQRKAMKLIIDNSFEDDALGLTPELVRHMGKEYWWDPSGMSELMADPSTTVHDMVGSVQAVGLSLVMNPGTLRRVYDNEFRTQGQDDVFTMNELITSVTDAAWREVAEPGPEISSFRRNLQRQHVEYLITLSLLDQGSPVLRTISTLANVELKRIDKMADKAQGSMRDAYSSAHLSDIRTRIAKALEASYVIDR